MKYDFETLIPRYGVGSGKWDEMREEIPDIPDDIVPLSVADMEFKNAPEIVEGLKEYLDTSILGYTHATDAYYRAVTGWMERRHGFSPKKEWFVEYAGVVPALRHMVGVFTKPGDSVMITTPVYYPFRGAAEFNRCHVVENELIEKDGRYTIDFADFEEKAKREEVKLYILCSPHNPVGRVWTEDELRRIAEICLANDVFILSDEIHFDLIMPGYRHVSMMNLEEKYRDNCAVCTSPGKTFNLAGMQASNIFISDERRREAVRRARGHFSLNALSYKATELAYTRSEEWMREMLGYIDANKTFVTAFLREHLPFVKVTELEGTYLLWLDFRALGLPKQELEELMRKKAYLFLDEGYIFGRGGEGFERLNLACPRRVLAGALERLEKAVLEIYRA